MKHVLSGNCREVHVMVADEQMPTGGKLIVAGKMRYCSGVHNHDIGAQ